MPAGAHAPPLVVKQKPFMRHIAIVIFSFSVLSGFSQKEDYVWLLGDNFPPDSIAATSLIDFNNVPLEKKLLYEFVGFFGTNANISDPGGNLLLYTNGVHLYNAQHEIVENGEEFQPSDTWSFGYPAIQGGMLFPYPGHPGRFIFPLCDEVFFQYNGWTTVGCSPLTYSVIDLNIGQGVVTEKKTALTTDTLQMGQLSGVQHGNGRDWWLVSAPTDGTNRFHKFLVSPEGITLHDVQYVGETFNPGLGQVAVSPDGEMIAYYNWFGIIGVDTDLSVDLYDFDRCSGQLSNHLQMVFEDDGATGGIAFSPNSKILYVSDRFEIYQFDLEAPDIMASRTVVAVQDGFLDEWGQPSTFSLMKLAPDGKIYIAATTLGTRYMHVIEQPDLLGPACDVQQHSFLLPTYNNRSLPHHPVFRLGTVEGSPCDTIVYTATSETGDGPAFKVFPNPTSGTVSVEYALPSGQNAEWVLSDALGREVWREILPADTGSHSIVLVGMGEGLYIYRVVANGQWLAGGKLLLVR